MLNGVPQRPLEGVSFAHTFDGAAAPTAKRVQYYEMIGSRALWADGWKAVVEQPQGEMMTEAMLDAQQWELYHVDEDFSESADLAASAPGEAEGAHRALVGGGRQVQRAAARFAHAGPHGRAQALDRRFRQPPRLLPRHGAAVRVHRGRPEEPLAHHHRRGRGSRIRRGGRAARPRQLVRRLFAVREEPAPRLRAQLSRAGRVPHRLDRRGSGRPRRPGVPLHAHRRASRPRGVALRRPRGRRGRDPAHDSRGDRNLGRGPVLRLRFGRAGDARLRRRPSVSPGASRAWSWRLASAAQRTMARHCARP